MARRPAVLEDPTPLDGSRIEIGVRIGWLLRSSRVAGGVDLRTMADLLGREGVPVSAASLSRLETGRSRNGSVIDGYERVLGLETGRLRAAVDALCRTFDHAPVDESPDPEPLGLAGFGDLVEAVGGPGPCAGDWLRFAREHQLLRGFGLTAGQMRPLVRTLASELNRSVGNAYPSRYEALARLRCSPYGDVVEQVVRELVLAPDAQVFYDLTSAVSERPSSALLVWAGELLNHDALTVVRGGDILVQNMRSVGGLADDDWPAIVEPFLTAFERAADDPARRQVLTGLFKNLPPEVRAAILPRLSQPLAPVRGPQDWTKTRRNVHYGFATELAQRVCASLGTAEEPLLARLLFEILYDFRGPRATTAAILVMASPFATALHPILVDAARSGPDESDRDRLRGAISMTQTADDRPRVDDWLASGDEDLLRIAYTLSGHSGQLLDDDQLEAGLLAAPTTMRLVLYAAGMAGDHRLDAISRDESRPEAVRAAAAYWVRAGSRILR